MPLRSTLAISLAALVLVPLAAGSKTSVSATASLARSGDVVLLTLRNTGTEPIKCWQLRPVEPVLVTGITSPPAGWQLGAPGPPPQPLFGGRSEAGIPPGGSATFGFKTDIPYPVNGGGVLQISADCKTDVSIRATGPPAASSTAPKPKPKQPAKCKCESLEAEVERVVKKRSGERIVVDVHLSGTLECTKGSGGCEGQLEVVPSGKFRFFVLDGLDVTCKGRCDRRTNALQLFTLSSGRADAAAADVTFSARMTCSGRTVQRACAIRFLKDSPNVVDRKASDLDGNRIRDGREKK